MKRQAGLRLIAPAAGQQADNTAQVLKNFSDDELLRLTMAGDEEAFVTLYRRRQVAVYRFALQMSGSAAIAEDVTQEVFMTLMRDSENYDPERGPLSSYLYGIARNYVLRYLKQDQPYVPMDVEQEDADGTSAVHPITVADPLGDLTRHETIEQVRQAVLALPAHYREVVVLCDLHEMNYAEAAAALSCAVGTVRSRLHRARALLAEKLRGAGQREATPQRINTARCFA
jgi:RNA polymerase sigma-70 factor (ECF subfamily)